jgi:hypothetical protein
MRATAGPYWQRATVGSILTGHDAHDALRGHNRRPGQPQAGVDVRSMEAAQGPQDRLGEVDEEQLTESVALVILAS